MIKISVVISTFNPNMQRLDQTLAGLKNQTFLIYDWELLIIDNNSTISFIDKIDISWHNNARIIRELNLGLTYARIRGYIESSSEIIVMVDDDNILSPDYLTIVYNTFENDKELGAIGGKSLPLFDSPPPSWLKHFYGNLALRDLGDKIIIEKWKNYYPDSAPIGAGMGLRKFALQNYINKVNSGNSRITDRRGTTLSSGGDNDIIIEVLKAGWKVAYVPALFLKHIIPLERVTKSYLGKLNKDSTKSWLILLDEHKINPWNKIPKWTLNLRKLKAFILHKPWKDEVSYIRWKGVCGMYEALADLPNKK